MKKTKLAALMTLTLANIAGLCFVTFAWFIAKNNIDSNADQISVVAGSDVDIDHTLYAYDENAKAGVITEDFSLQQYDSFILERNVYACKILRVEVTGSSSSSFTVEIPCSGSFTTKSQKDQDRDIVASNISNIVSFKYLVKSDYPSIDETNAATIYSTAKTAFDGISTSKSFVTVGASIATSQKNDTIRFSNINLNASTGKQVIYIEYNYDETLVDFFYQNSDASAPSVDSIQENEIIDFAADISTIKFTGGGDA